jgi:hypothetical protein
MAVMLAHDEYDGNVEGKTISVTSLLRPLKSLALSSRVEESQTDVSWLVDSRVGTAIHDLLERSWTRGYRENLKALGWSDRLIERVKINPSQVEPDDIPVHVEIRSERRIRDWTVTGKFDLCVNGKLYDLKTNKTYSYITNNSLEDYILQLSMYAWLNPEIVTEPVGEIMYLFTDFQERMTYTSGYPSSRIVGKTVMLKESFDTERWIERRLEALEAMLDMPQEHMSDCSPRELWQSKSKWAVYRDLNNRPARVLDSQQEAYVYNAAKLNGRGIIQERKGTVKRCHWCPASAICHQAERLRETNQLSDKE